MPVSLYLWMTMCGKSVCVSYYAHMTRHAFLYTINQHSTGKVQCHILKLTGTFGSGRTTDNTKLSNPLKQGIVGDTGGGG